MEAIDKLQSMFDEMKSTVTDKVVELQKKVDSSGEDIEKKVNEEIHNLKIELDAQKARIEEQNAKGRLPGVEEEKKNFSFLRAFTLINGNTAREVVDKKEYGLEKEIFENMRTKAQTAGDGSAGGYLVPDELSDMIIEPAIAAMPLYQLGMQTMSGLRGSFHIPVMDTRGSAGHTTENGTPTEVSFTFGQRAMTPKRAAGYTKVSKQLMLQSNPGTEAFIRRQLQTSLQLIIHKNLIQGTGSDSKPKGLENWTSEMTSGPTCNGQFTIAHARRMKTQLEEADYMPDTGRPGYLTRPTVVEGVLLDRTTYFSGQTSGKGYVFAPPVLSDDELDQRIGAPIRSTTHVTKSGSGATATTHVFYGDFSQAILGLWQGLSLSASDTASDSTNHGFLENLVFLKAEQLYDFTIGQPAALTYVSDALADRTNFS